MYIIIVGGGRIGYYLAKTLINEGHEVLLVEKDRRKVTRISEDLGEIVFWGDGCEMRTLNEIGTARADVVIAVTGDDEDNLVICQLAKRKFNVKQCIALVTDPANEENFKRLGVTPTISSTKIIYNLIEQEVESEEVKPVMPLDYGNIEFIKLKLKDTSPIVNKKIKELNIAKECIFVTILRGKELIVPRGNIELKKDDTIVAITPIEKEPHVRKLLTGK